MDEIKHGDRVIILNGHGVDPHEVGLIGVAQVLKGRIDDDWCMVRSDDGLHAYVPIERLRKVKK